MAEQDLIEALKRLRDRQWQPGLAEPAAIGELQAALPAIIAALAAAEPFACDDEPPNPLCPGCQLRAALEGRVSPDG